MPRHDDAELHQAGYRDGLHDQAPANSEYAYKLGWIEGYMTRVGVSASDAVQAFNNGRQLR